MTNFIIGFLSCFLFLLLMGQVKRIVLFLKKQRIVKGNKKSKKGQDEQVAMGETIVAVLNSGEPNERVITNIKSKEVGFLSRLVSFLFWR